VEAEEGLAYDYDLPCRKDADCRRQQERMAWSCFEVRRGEEEGSALRPPTPGLTSERADKYAPHAPSGRDAAHGEVLDAISKWAGPLRDGRAWRCVSAYQMGYHMSGHASGRKRTVRIPACGLELLHVEVTVAISSKCLRG
jgi:hypothetical protein